MTTPEQMEAAARVRDAENDLAESRALESAWDKIDNKIQVAVILGRCDEGKGLNIKFTLLELKMLRQFRRKFA